MCDMCIYTWLRDVRLTLKPSFLIEVLLCGGCLLQFQALNTPAKCKTRRPDE